MSDDNLHLSFQLLQFTVPGMPHIDLALPLAQVLEVGELLPATPLPFTPFFVTGVSQWRGQPITVIDLAALMYTQQPANNTSYSEAHDVQHRYVIAQLAVEHRIELIAWPVLFPVKTVAVPTRLEQASPLDGVVPWLVFSTVVMDNPLVLLDIDQVVVGFSVSSSTSN
jgi:chemotaxis signal transduction protein